MYSKVKYFVLFLGYARSGSTLTGSIMDAHPNVIISNEYQIIGKFPKLEKGKKKQKFIFDSLYQSSKREVDSGQRSPNFKGLFNYHVPNQWQGQYLSAVKVIHFQLF